MARNGPCTISGTRTLFLMHLVGGGERCVCTTCFFNRVTPHRASALWQFALPQELH